MYGLLDVFSELLERYSLVIVGGLLGALAIALLWSKVSKFEPRRKSRPSLLTDKEIAKIGFASFAGFFGIVGVLALATGQLGVGFFFIFSSICLYAVRIVLLQ